MASFGAWIQTLWAEGRCSGCARAKASNGAAAASQVYAAAVSAEAWLGGPDKVRTTASVSDAGNMVATLIEGALQGLARQGLEIGAGNPRRCLVADLMA
jgi:hypothetical protein